MSAEVAFLGMPSRVGRLLAGQLTIARQQDGAHCAVCGRHIGFWFYGFPYPLCCLCLDRKRGPVQLQCPARYEPCTRCPSAVASVVASVDGDAVNQMVTS